MTTTVERRPPTRHPKVAGQAAGRPGPSPLGPGALGAAWALGAGLVAFAVPVLLVWAADRRSGAGAVQAARTAGQLWLLAHGAWLAVPGGVVGLVPLGLTAVPLALLHRAGRHGARLLQPAEPRAAAQLVLAIALPYGLTVTCLTAVLSTASVRASPLHALPGSLVVAAVGAGAGVLRETGLLRVRVPERVRSLVRATAVATGVLLAAGGLLVLGSVLAHLARVTALSGATGPGVVGGTALLLAQLLLLPNAMIWGACWLAGPGFAVGLGTAVGPWATSLGAVPAVPVLGALPAGPAPVWMAVAGLAVPLLAGGLAGAIVARRLAVASVLGSAREAAIVGPAAGVVLALLAALSGGPLGGGRLSAVGPSPWQVGLTVMIEVGLSAAAGAALVAYRRR